MRNLIALAIVGLLAGSAEARHVKFHGAHPISAKHGGGYCYIEAPHMHLYAPEHAASFQQDQDGFVYVGALPPEVEVVSPRVVIQAPLPPDVTVEAPGVDVRVPAPPGVVVEAPPPPRVEVSLPFPPPPPRVEVRVPGPPRIEVRAELPPPPRVYLPPPPRVYVAPPSVRVSAPGVYVGEGRGHHGDDDRGEGREHHDNGKHKGWR